MSKKMSKKKQKPTMEQALSSRPKPPQNHQSPQTQEELDKIVADSMEEKALMDYLKSDEEKERDNPPRIIPFPVPVPREDRLPTVVLQKVISDIKEKLMPKEIPVLTTNPQPESIQTSSEESPESPKTEETTPPLSKDELGQLDQVTQEEDHDADCECNVCYYRNFRKVWRDKSAEGDPELQALLEYVREDGFVVSTVAMNILLICGQPIVSPTTTTWMVPKGTDVPKLVYTLLLTPGYLESIWPSLKVMLGLSSGNAAWASGVATTIAFFDTVKMLPYLEELK